MEIAPYFGAAEVSNLPVNSNWKISIVLVEYNPLFWSEAFDLSW